MWTYTDWSMIEFHIDLERSPKSFTSFTVDVKC